MEKGRAFISWSGGKDSALALHRARSRGFRVAALLNMLDQDGGRSRSHGLPPALVASQARSLGCELIQPRASWKDYEQEFKKACMILRRFGVTDGVFGDIAVEEHREWVERVCREHGLRPRLPLWGEGARDLLEEFLELGFRAVIVSVELSRLDESFLGRELDLRALEDVSRSGVDPSGESGEYHTVVLGGPGFSFSIEIARARRHVLGERGYLDIVEWKEGA